MATLKTFLENNKKWAKSMNRTHPGFFEKLSKQQKPKYLWISCSDSRVPANEMVGLLPGELFVHRNIANLVIQTDFNCLSVIEYAVERLKVEHIIVCGHYGCGGVKAAFGHKHLGLIDNWLRHVEDVYFKYEKELKKLKSDEEKLNYLCELNVKEQVRNVCNTTIVQKAWRNGQKLVVHGWIYSLGDGLLQNLKLDAGNNREVKKL